MKIFRLYFGWTHECGTVYCSVWRRYICYLSILFWGCLDDVKVKDVRRCSARRARRIRGFNPHRSRNIYMDYVSTVVEKDKCCCYRWEKYHNSAQTHENSCSKVISILTTGNILHESSSAPRQHKSVQYKCFTLYLHRDVSHTVMLQLHFISCRGV